jgi:hypothetical protein
MIGAVSTVGTVVGRDAGGQGPTGADTGVRVLVPPSDEASACRILASYDYTRTRHRDHPGSPGSV